MSQALCILLIESKTNTRKKQKCWATRLCVSSLRISCCGLDFKSLDHRILMSTPRNYCYRAHLDRM